MATPHRGLPPPAAMALPSAQTSSLPLPHQWQGTEETHKIWLQANMEEDKRKAEEERSRQENMRVESRRIELEMLREALRGGVPPPLIPVMFAGASLRGPNEEWINEYFARDLGRYQQHLPSTQQQPPQQQQHHPHPQPTSQSPQGPGLRRETRLIGQGQQQPPGPSAQQPPQLMSLPPGTPITPQQQQQQGPVVGHVGSYPPYSLPGISTVPSRGGPPIQPIAQPQPPPPPPPQRTLPRINTNEIPKQTPPQPMAIQMQLGPPTQQQQGLAPPPPPPPPAPQSESSTQPPVIFFHHWVPPGSQAPPTTTHPTAPGMHQLDSPFTHHPPSNQLTTGTEYTNSPKKRKTISGQSSQPTIHSSAPSQTFSPTQHGASSASNTPSRTRRGHSRNRSETTGSIARGFDSYPRSTKHRRSIGESSISEGTSSMRQLPPVATSAGSDNGGGGGGGGNGGTPQQQQQQQKQQHSSQDQHQHSRPQPDPPNPHDYPRPQSQPSQHQPQPKRPYSAGSDFKRDPYPLPQHPPSGEGREEQGSGGSGRN